MTVRKGKVKCLHCGEQGEKTTMVMIPISAKSNRYCHSECYEEYNNKKEWQEKETSQRNDLYYKIIDIYGLNETSMLPKMFYANIERLRNGNPIWNKHVNKRDKQGYNYYIILKTYERCEKDIKMANKTKRFKSLSASLQYGLRIILDRIINVEREILEKEEVSLKLENLDIDKLEAMSMGEEYYEIEEERKNKKSDKKKNKRDISDFLDDDF